LNDQAIGFGASLAPTLPLWPPGMGVALANALAEAADAYAARRRYTRGTYDESSGA